jgi:hypothetical protein
MKEGSNKNNGMCYFKYFLYFKLFRLLSWLQGERFVPYKVQWDTYVCT